MTVSPVILEEVRLFFMSVGLGFFLAVIYEFLRLFRKLVKHALLARSVEDFCYWIFSGLACFVLIFRENDGILRGFVILGVLIGMLLQEWVIFPAIFHKKC